MPVHFNNLLQFSLLFLKVSDFLLDNVVKFLLQLSYFVVLLFFRIDLTVVILGCRLRRVSKQFAKWVFIFIRLVAPLFSHWQPPR